MTAEIDALVSEDPVLKLPASGIEVRILSLKTRQFFRLVKIITRGAGTALQDFRLDASQSQDEFAGKLIAVVLLSVPEAEDEAIQFIQSMVEPVGLIDGPAMTPADRAHNDKLWEPHRFELYNPELEDTVTVLEKIVEREAADIQSLGKRLQAMFKMAQKTGQLPSTENLKPSDSTPTESSVDSAEPSISLVPSTAGKTKKS